MKVRATTEPAFHIAPTQTFSTGGSLVDPRLPPRQPPPSTLPLRSHCAAAAGTAAPPRLLLTALAGMLWQKYAFRVLRRWREARQCEGRYASSVSAFAVLRQRVIPGQPPVTGGAVGTTAAAECCEVQLGELESPSGPAMSTPRGATAPVAAAAQERAAA